MEDRFLIRFASSEKEFLTQYGVNFGFTQVHSKVDRCYFLSSDAKALYHNLSQYAYNGSKECFPSQALLRAELGWSKHSVTKYVEELRQKGFIKTIRNPARPLMYLLEELHQVPVLVHSEIVHEIRKELFNSDERELFVNALLAYKNSETCGIISNSVDPAGFKENIRQWYLHWQSGGCEETLEMAQQLISSQQSMTIRGREQNLVREEGNERIGKPAELEKSSEFEKLRKKSTGKGHDEASVEDWNTNHFRNYFMQLYKEKYDSDYSWIKEDQKTMHKLREAKKDNNIVKEAIEQFFNIDQFVPKTVRLFGSTNTQAVLDEFSRTGKLPWYMISKNSKPLLGSSGDEYDTFS